MTVRLSIAPNLYHWKNAEIDCKVVTEGYITFAGCVFDSDIPFVIGIHFRSFRIKYIEIFRTAEYYQSEKYDINTSFAELFDILKKKYGNPMVTTAASINGYPWEQWIVPGYIVNHYIMDRFGLEEHLHINFYKG